VSRRALAWTRARAARFGPHPSGERKHVLNPLRSESEAFRFLVYVAVIVAIIVGIVLLVRAL
jgi:hypothetical protein